MNRYKEIAVRIVAGASPRTIRCQFLGESVLLSVIAYILSILISINIISLVNSSFHQNMHFSLSDNFSYLLFFLLISIIVGLISGSYVAFYYSGLKPVLAFSRLGGLKPGKPSVWKVLLIVQMVLFIGLILITTAIGRQITYLKTSDMGFDSKGLMYVYLEDNEMKQYHAILNELDKDPNILNAAGGDDLPPTNNRGVDILESPSDPSVKIRMESQTFDYGSIEMLGIKLISGRSFSRDLASDSVKAFILNETAAKALGIKYNVDSIWAGPEIIGIVKDFFVHSKHEKIVPTRIRICKDKYLCEIVIRCRPEKQSEIKKSLEKLWRNFFGEVKPNCILFEDAIEDMYSGEEELVKLLTFFTSLTIAIAILGLFAFSLFIVEKRNKEIGIRKVNGATSLDIFISISWEFMILVIISMILSFSIGWYIIHKWQQNFAYHEGPGFLIFLKSGILALVVVQLTVFIHVLKASRSNPVKSLRYE